MIELNTEVLVVGSGFGGAIAASRLVEQGRQVVMLERGPWRRTLPTSTMNIRSVAELPRSSWWYLFRNGLASFSDFRLTDPRGQGFNRCSGTFEVNNHPHFVSLCTNQVGGGSLNWCGAIARADKADYWDNRADGVSESILAPHYDRVYDELGASVLGNAAEVPDCWARYWESNSELDFSANQTVSVAHRLPGREANRDVGWGIERAESEFRRHMSLGCLDGSKASTDAIFIGPALAGGMTLLARCEAEGVSSAPNGGYSIRARRLDTGVHLLIHCQKLIIGAGTYNTLRLLFGAQASGELAAMPALGNGISGNGDEPAFLWNTTVAEQGEPRRGLFSMFHLRKGRRDLTHGFIEADLPSTRWSFFRKLAKRLNNTLLLVSMGVDASDGRAAYLKNRFIIDFDPAKSEINQVGRSEHREIAKLLGAKIFLIPKRLTLHLSGGAKVGHSADTGVVNGLGEVWNNPNLYIVDSAVFPEAPGGPPALNIAAWASHVATSIFSSTPEIGTGAAELLSDIQIGSCSVEELSLLFACLAKPLSTGDTDLQLQPGTWRAQPLASVKRRWVLLARPIRAFTFKVAQILPVLETLKPDISIKECCSIAEAWDGSGLAWQWTGAEDGDLLEIQFRIVMDEGQCLAFVYRNHKKEGWFKLISDQ